MRYVVYGAGAVGGVVGGTLARAGHAVTLVARGAHLEAIRAGGLVLDAGDGRHRVEAPATDTAAEVAWNDDTVVLLAVSVAGASMRCRPSPASSTRPPARMASRWAPRATSVTAWPARASVPPTTPPTAPAP